MVKYVLHMIGLKLILFYVEEVSLYNLENKNMLNTITLLPAGRYQ